MPKNNKNPPRKSYAPLLPVSPSRRLFLIKVHIYEAVQGLREMQNVQVRPHHERMIVEIVHQLCELAEQVDRFYAANGLANY